MTKLLLVLVYCFAACGEEAALRDASAQPDMATAQESQAAPGGSQGGSLPPGYYQRQCQWDACGGPAPDRRPSTDPTPEERP